MATHGQLPANSRVAELRSAAYIAHAFLDIVRR
jgi:hypothetical protein